VQGDPEVLAALNELLTAELTAINQYYVHSKMCAHWRYMRLAAKKMEESREEMRHADKLIERILYLDGVPNMQRLNAVRVGENPIEQHEVDLALEREAVARLNGFIELFRSKGDNGSRMLAEEMLKEEEEAIDWHEAQLDLVQTLGRDHYLAHQMHGS
jgi:bacterioferritin